jgi:hypothetical protein
LAANLPKIAQLAGKGTKIAQHDAPNQSSARDTLGRMASPMVRVSVGVVVTLVFFGLDHALGVGAAAVAGVWVILGIASVIRAAAEQPKEHRLQMQLEGSVLHAVVETRPASPPPLPGPPPDVARQISSMRPSMTARRREKLIECPRCSQYVFLPTTSCTCGWIVPEATPSPSARKLVTANVSDSGEAEARPQQMVGAVQPRVCPACPQCRAPTQWVSEFERFFCARCDAYVSAQR